MPGSSSCRRIWRDDWLMAKTSTNLGAGGVESTTQTLDVRPPAGAEGDPTAWNGQFVFVNVQVHVSSNTLMFPGPSLFLRRPSTSNSESPNHDYLAHCLSPRSISGIDIGLLGKETSPKASIQWHSEWVTSLWQWVLITLCISVFIVHWTCT